MQINKQNNTIRWGHVKRLPSSPAPFTQMSMCFLSNLIKNIHILALGPELQAVRFGYVILGENWREKKGPIHKRIYSLYRDSFGV